MCPISTGIFKQYYRLDFFFSRLKRSFKALFLLIHKFFSSSFSLSSSSTKPMVSTKAQVLSLLVLSLPPGYLGDCRRWIRTNGSCKKKTPRSPHCQLSVLGKGIEGAWEGGFLELKGRLLDRGNNTTVNLGE